MEYLRKTSALFRLLRTRRPQIDPPYTYTMDRIIWSWSSLMDNTFNAEADGKGLSLQAAESNVLFLVEWWALQNSEQHNTAFGPHSWQELGRTMASSRFGM